MENENTLPMFFEVWFDDNEGKRRNASVQTRDLRSRPDCQIGHFEENWYFRTQKATSLKFKGYGDLKGYKKAVKLSLIKRGFKNISFEC